MGRSSTCPECGTPLVSGGLVCSRCGATVVSTKADLYRLVIERMDGLDKRVTKLEERLKKENGEEMGKLRGRGEMTEEVCTICGRTFEAVKGGDSPHMLGGVYPKAGRRDNQGFHRVRGMVG